MFMVSAFKSDAPRDNSMLLGGEILLSRWSRDFMLIDAVEQSDFRGIDNGRSKQRELKHSVEV
jgi:hypothetical protein